MVPLVLFTLLYNYSEEKDKNDVDSDHLTQGSRYLFSKHSECK